MELIGRIFISYEQWLSVRQVKFQVLVVDVHSISNVREV